MSKNKEWYRIIAKADKTADVSIYEQIGESFWDGSGVTAKRFINEINGLDVETINLYINSPGGDVFDGTAIYNALKRHKAKVHVVIDGIAASIASVIAMAGDTIEMPENAMMMIHDPSGGVWGTADDMLAMAEALEKVKSGLVAAYRDKSGMEDSDISKLMTDETWLTAKEAVEYGLADTMTGKVNIQANLNGPFNYKHVPEFLMKAAESTNSKEVSDMKITMEILEKDAPELLAQIKDAARGEVTIETFSAQVKEAETKAGDAERERVMAMFEAAYGKETAEKFKAVVKPGATIADMMTFAQDKTKSDMLAKLQTAAPESLGNLEDVTTATAPDPNTEEGWRAQYDKDAALKAEFGDVERYVAFKRADANGQVKIKRKGE